MSVPAIGNVLTPSGFQIVSAEAQVIVSWNPTPLTTIFYINRSTDNVTFTNIASTTSLSYADTSAVPGTVYYYAIQAGNGTASSNPTVSLSGVSLTPGKTTVGNLRLQAQQRCDLVNSTQITTQEWNSMINESFKELYDVLIQKFGDDYYVATPYTYTTDQTQQLYALPNDFYKLLICEVALNPADQNSWVTLRQFQFIQKNLWNYPNQYTFYGITNLRYRLNGSNLMIVPYPSGGQTIRIWYAPRQSQLINDTQIIDGINGYEEYVVVDCCIKALTKREEDPTIFGLQKQALLTRIDAAAGNRNIGEPQCVSDSKVRNFAWTDDSGGSFGSNY